MKFVLLILVPILVAFAVAMMTNFWLWGVLSFPVAMLAVNWIAVALFGRPDNKELKRITNRPVEEDFSKEELALEARQIASKFGLKMNNKQPVASLVDKNNWSQEKARFYETPFDIDLKILEKVTQGVKEHYTEIDNHWQSMSSHRRVEILKVFSDNIAKDWPIEYSELFANGNMEIIKSCADWVQKAYLAGYMLGKGWISIDELTHANWCYASFLLDDITKTLGIAKSRSTALAVALMEVSSQGAGRSVWKMG
jgi:intein/homing endonuclease